MSIESLTRIAQLKSPSDFLGAVMGRSGKSDITREDVLAAMANHSDQLGQALFFYWLFGSGREDADCLGIEAARGGWLVSTPFMADRNFLTRFGRAAVGQVVKPRKTEKVIADINEVSTQAVRKNMNKYQQQIKFLNLLSASFNRKLYKSKCDFLKYFDEEN